MHAASMMRSSYVMSGYSFAIALTLARNRPSLIFMMLALWIAVTRVRPLARACSNANLPMRVDAASVMIFMLSTMPGTISCSRPA